nr:MAG TPA: Major head protein [Caudoviricetes sp.]
MAAETNLIKKNDLARVREIEFVELFGYSIKKLMEALGVTWKIAKQAGAVLKSYKATGTLESGAVAEGDTIPLSHYKTEPVTYKEITLRKWRKATSAEAITDRGYDQAVEMTTDEMLKDVQKGIRKNFFDFLATGTGAVSGKTFQTVLAQAWGNLQVLFEDDDVGAIYFMNPLDVADYLSAANITTQTAFGLTYVQNFLGLGTLIMNSSVPKGKVYATVQNNIVLYYIPVNGADLQEVFTFTTDTTGYIGIHEEPDYTNMTASDTIINGIELFAERLDGVIVGTIDNGTLGSLTVTSASGTKSGDTKLTVSPAKAAAGHKYKYASAATAPTVSYFDNVAAWADWDGKSDLTIATGQKVTVVECDGNFHALKSGSADVTAKT